MIEREKLIDKFLSQSLTDEELAVFKEKWANDKAFVAAVRARATLKLAVAASEQVENLGQTKRSAARWPTKRLPKKWAFGIAASLALLMVAGISLTLRNTDSARGLAQTHMIQLRLQGTREASRPSQRWQTALQAHAHGDTRLAISLLKDALKTTGDKARYRHILGDLYMASEQPDSALHYYGQATANTVPDSYTQWNTAMAWLQKGELDMAKQYLASMEGPYAKRAATLAEKMDKPAFRLKNWFFQTSGKP